MSDLKYPLSVSGGQLVLQKYAGAEAVMSVLSTVRGERVYRPEYGTPASLFDPDSKVPSELGMENIQTRLEYMAGRLDVTVIEVV